MADASTWKTSGNARKLDLSCHVGGWLRDGFDTQCSDSLRDFQRVFDWSPNLKERARTSPCPKKATHLSNTGLVGKVPFKVRRMICSTMRLLQNVINRLKDGKKSIALTGEFGAVNRAFAGLSKGSLRLTLRR